MTTRSRPTHSSPRPTLEEYPQWLQSVHSIEVNEALRNLTETNLRNILNTANENLFFLAVPDILEEASEDYYKQTHTRLLASDADELSLKPYKSIVEKSYRLNIAWNNKWPRVPEWKTQDRAEWVTPDNWYEAFDDLARSTVVAKYIDGPKFIGDRLTKLADSHRLTWKLEPRALDVGYYAYHFYVEIPVQLFRRDWSRFTSNIWVELQLTTQLQEAARELTHEFYVADRAELKRGSSWKWDYHSDRFKAAHISHSLRLIEALIVELRKNSREPPNPPSDAPETPTEPSAGASEPDPVTVLASPPTPPVEK